MVVLGRRSPTRPPLMRRPATDKMGMAQLESTRYPKAKLPKMAPIRAATKVTDMAVDLEKKRLSILIPFLV